MDREDVTAASLVRGIGCGVAAWIAAAAAVWLLVAGASLAVSPATVGRLFVAAHQPITTGVVADLAPLTWFGLPSATLFAVPPLTLASAGVVAGRLTKETDHWLGARAGSTVVIGYVLPIAVVALFLDADVGLVVASATLVSLVCGAIGGVVGVRT
jgi:hypothetical protein